MLANDLVLMSSLNNKYKGKEENINIIKNPINPKSPKKLK